MLSSLYGFWNAEKRYIWRYITRIYWVFAVYEQTSERARECGAWWAEYSSQCRLFTVTLLLPIIWFLKTVHIEVLCDA